ncbi:MAG: hypothetical protein GY788_28810, partial [bacterium]|nr:hypothetical protein [bacterium]
AGASSQEALKAVVDHLIEETLSGCEPIGNVSAGGAAVPPRSEAVAGKA